MKRLNEVVVRPGDIILASSTATVSKAIRLATRSDISHAMVCVARGSIIDATGEGVQARNTQRIFFEEECVVHVMRLRGGFSDERLAKVCNYLRTHIGTEYSAKEAMLTALGGARQWSKKQFCSRLVAQAFASADIELVADPNFCSPANLMASPLLVSVEDATVPVAAEEAAWWEASVDVPQRMRDAINEVLDGARTKDPGIQTFSDVDLHLVRHPEDDDDLCEMLEASGYLSVWEIEWKKNLWQYDIGLMRALPAGPIEDYCWNLLADEDRVPNRYIVNRAGYLVFARQYDLNYFHLMVTLYDRLVALHRQRIETAGRWLEENGLLRRTTPSPLLPHTPEWFAALERWDPPKAMITREIVRRCGRLDVCSVCGDDPASDYLLAEGHMPPIGVNTLRLCDDCVAIRRAGGEPFELLTGSDEVDSHGRNDRG